MSISLIVGLGNPGSSYGETRHNLGFIVVDVLAKSLGFEWHQEKSLDAFIAKGVYRGESLRLMKPQSYMNLSGQCLAKACRYYKIPSEEVVVIQDDINLEFGKIKISRQGGAGGHNGVEDILAHFGNDFIRYRIGIGGKPHSEMELKDHVLGKITEDEKSVLTTRLPKFIYGLNLLLEKGVVEAMNQINQKE